MKWADIPDSFKLSMMIVAAAMGVVGYLTTFQTDAEAQAYQQQHNQQLTSIRVDEIEDKIQNIRYQLLSTTLSPEQREWLYSELKRLEAKKQCIMDGKC